MFRFIFIPRLFGGHCKQNCSPNFFLSVVLLVFKKVTRIYVLIFYPTILLNVLISCRSFLMESLCSFMHRIISPGKKDTLTSFFPIYLYLLYLSYCSSSEFKHYTKWKRKSRGLYLVPDFGENVLIFPV